MTIIVNYWERVKNSLTSRSMITNIAHSIQLQDSDASFNTCTRYVNQPSKTKFLKFNLEVHFYQCLYIVGSLYF